VAFGQFVEKTKDTIIYLIREHFKAEGWAYEEMPNMEKFSFYSNDPYETYTRILTRLPDIDQQLPLIAVTVGNASGKSMGFGRLGDYLGMVKDNDGYWYKRYSSAIDMTVNIDVGSEDENTRTQLVDIVAGVFQFYLRDIGWEYNPDPESDDLFQIIFDKVVSIGAEAEIPKPENDGFDKIFTNRVNFDCTFIDYVDRLAEGQGKTGPGVPETHKGPIQVIPDTNPEEGHYYPNLRWTKD
jgi:hypothetical protein